MNLSDPVDAQRFVDIMAGLEFHAWLEDNYKLDSCESAYAMLIWREIQKLEHKLALVLKDKERIYE
jgi:hypothetical protein